MPRSVLASELADFQCRLIGTWRNDEKLTVGKGKNRRPLSFNVMPLPQVDPQFGRGPGSYGGFILKNFTFTETIRFNGSAKPSDSAQHRDPGALAAIAGAPNRGGSYTQFAHAVFYDQQVQFAEGPQGPPNMISEPPRKIGDIVHVENGAWLHLDSIAQQRGPYGPDFVAGAIVPQPPYVPIAKQISVPHGNSVLALGSVDIFGQDKKGNDLTILSGRPTIPDAFVPYPAPADTVVGQYADPYTQVLTDPEYENPNIAWTWNANKPLQLALNIIKPQSHIHWRVSTNPTFGGKGHVTNIPFEESKSKVIAYWADYWLLSKDQFNSDEPEKNKSNKFDYLAYTQTILMELEISVDNGKNFAKYIFPHVTSNTVKKVSGDPTQARRLTEGLEKGASPHSVRSAVIKDKRQKASTRRKRL